MLFIKSCAKNGTGNDGDEMSYSFIMAGDSFLFGMSFFLTG